eukprot:SAG11_NODE_3024_length_2755_cov_0.965361_1_plen_101_part_00
MNQFLADAEDDANPFLVDGAARTREFVPSHADPSDEPEGPVPEEVWASDEFQDNLYNWTRVHMYAVHASWHLRWQKLVGWESDVSLRSHDAGPVGSLNQA